MRVHREIEDKGTTQITTLTTLRFMTPLQLSSKRRLGKIETWWTLVSKQIIMIDMIDKIDLITMTILGHMTTRDTTSIPLSSP